MSKAMEMLADARKKHNRFEMKCIFPDCNGNLCGKNPIRSHSIQHNGILSKISENGIVYCLGETTKGDEIFEYDLKDKGISKEASIFKCLCGEHDDVLFADIEKKDFCKEPKQLFQFALKSLICTYWLKCNDCGITEKYKETIPIAKVNLEDQIAYRNELNRFWEIYHSGQYDNLISRVITINREINSAVSTSINILRKLDGTLFGEENKNYPILHISIFPSEDKSFILISTLKENEVYLNSLMSQFTMYSVETILKRFNVIIPLLSENIMISPRVVKKMTEKEKNDLLCIFSIEALHFYNNNPIDINRWSEKVSYNLW